MFYQNSMEYGIGIYCNEENFITNKTITNSYNGNITNNKFAAWDSGSRQHFLQHFIKVVY